MRFYKIFGVLFVAALALAGVLAVPTGPNSINQLNSGRYSTAASQSVTAQAGNVTEINIDAKGITQTWQGYFGNVTGNIVLGNSNNQTFYNWNLASARGEIYATRTASTPAWSSIKCADPTDVATEDTALGVNEATDADAASNTFVNTTDFDQFYVGSVNINTTQNCFATRLYNASGLPASSNFAEVLLHDGANLVYTGILDQQALGFDNRTHDFEMLVGQDGHNGGGTTTPYYFYVELG